MTDSKKALELLEALHQWRCEQARQQGKKPPVFHVPSCEQLAVITSALEPSLVVAGACDGPRRELKNRSPCPPHRGP